MFLALLVAFAAAATPFPTPVTLKTEDGLALAASHGAPSKAQNGVVFLHMAGRNKEDWQILADKFENAGSQVITVDLRGHGGSPLAAPLVAGDWVAMAADVKAALAYLYARGCTRVALVGAEVGANLAINAAAEDPRVTTVVLLSPGIDYKGVISIDAVRRFGQRPLLLVASADDTYGTRSASTLSAAAAGPHELKVYETAGKGTRMLNREPGLELLVLSWVGSHWQRSAAPAQPSATTIQVETRPLETSGPTQPDAPK